MYELTTPIQKLNPIKQMMYELLSTNNDPDDSSITANQQLGVSMSNAIKKDGVNIIQLQNVVSHKVAASAVEVLKMIDAIQIEALENPQPAYHNVLPGELTEVKKISAPESESIVESNDIDCYAIEDIDTDVAMFCKMCVTNKMPLSKFMDMMKRGYVKSALLETNTVKEASEVAGMNASAFSVMKRKMGF